jgi:hypothetical protein
MALLAKKRNLNLWVRFEIWNKIVYVWRIAEHSAGRKENSLKKLPHNITQMRRWNLYLYLKYFTVLYLECEVSTAD